MFGFKPSQQKNNSATQKKQGGVTPFSQGLTKTRDVLVGGLTRLIMPRSPIDASVLAELEDQLLVSDFGFQATQTIITQLKQQLSDNRIAEEDSLLSILQQSMEAMLSPCEIPLQLSSTSRPYVILMVGVNGVGKTTTAGKLAQQFKNQGHQVMLAAGDTFRAAAVEQIVSWGQKLDIPVIRQVQGADSASVIFDALQSAQARHADILIADTAGRLHTQTHLLDELAKIKRVIRKLDADAPHETMLVLDAGTGQNALTQARHFHDAIGISGVILTKLDGTAKGGMIFNVAEQLKLPIRYIGVGESAADLKPFNSHEFVTALLSESAH